MRRGYQPTKTMTFNSKPHAPTNTPSEKGEKMIINCDKQGYRKGMLVQQLEINLSEETKKFLLEALQPKHGKWVDSKVNDTIEKIYRCSNCGYGAWGEMEKTPFCPGCGAKMDKGGDTE